MRATQGRKAHTFSLHRGRPSEPVSACPVDSGYTSFLAVHLGSVPTGEKRSGRVRVASSEQACPRTHLPDQFSCYEHLWSEAQSFKWIPTG